MIVSFVHILEELRRLQSTAWVNAYIYNKRSIFQHKAIELLSAGRPVIVVPNESDEVRHIAKTVEVELKRCVCAFSVAETLEIFEKQNNVKVNSDKILHYSWEEQTVRLESVLSSVTGAK